MGQGQVLGQLPRFDPGHHADRSDGVLVHRIDVIHVVLHLRDHPAKIGNEPAEHPGFVQTAQGGFHIFAASEHFHEQPPGFRVGAHGTVDGA